jgi:hypothetical protein
MQRKALSIAGSLNRPIYSYLIQASWSPNEQPPTHRFIEHPQFTPSQLHMALPNLNGLVHVPQLAFQQPNKLNFQQNPSVFFWTGNRGGFINLRRARDWTMNELDQADEPCFITNNHRITLRVMVSGSSARRHDVNFMLNLLYISVAWLSRLAIFEHERIQQHG